MTVYSALKQELAYLATQKIIAVCSSTDRVNVSHLTMMILSIDNVNIVVIL